MYSCCCPRDYEAVATMYGTLLDVMTDHYVIFRRQYHLNIPFIKINRIEEKYVRYPRGFEDNLKEKRIQFAKECISLVDAGYSNSLFNDIHQERFRKEIAEYQMSRNEVWE